METFAKSLAIVRDMALIVVCVIVIVVVFSTASALNDFSDSVNSWNGEQPCIQDPNTPGCGRG